MAAPPRVLSIAGSDSGGGAGIQADLKAFARCGVHGMTAITAITAQNTVAVTAVHPVPPGIVIEQIRAVAQDIGVDAVKVGMLGGVAAIEAVAAALAELDPGVPVVVDPVMVAESGARLLEPDAERALLELILPRATVATPNVPEARVLARLPDPQATQAELAAAIAGPEAVVVTGGHTEEGADLYFQAGHSEWITGERHPPGAAHGSGCTHSSALAAHLAHGFAPLEAARRARRIAEQAVLHGLRGLGAGAGPVDALNVVSRTPHGAPARPQSEHRRG